MADSKFVKPTSSNKRLSDEDEQEEEDEEEMEEDRISQTRIDAVDGGDEDEAPTAASAHSGSTRRLHLKVCSDARSPDFILDVV